MMTKKTAIRLLTALLAALLLLSLAAYFRMKAGKTALYDMSDVTLANTPTNPTKPITPATPSSGSTASADTGDNSSLPLWLGGCLCSAAAILVLLQEKKRRAR